MKKDKKYKTLKDWYFDKKSLADGLTDKQFDELLYCLDFELRCQELENGVKVYYLKDLQGANLGNIEQDIFYCIDTKHYSNILNINDMERECWNEVKNLVISRLEIYLYDYFERDEICA